MVFSELIPSMIMAPSLIPKFLKYWKLKEANKIREDPKIADSGVTIEDLQANDIWCIFYHVLLTHDMRFTGCYSYFDEKKGPAIRFNPGLFKRLFVKTLREFEFDRNFSLVLSRLCKIKRFGHISKREPSCFPFQTNKQSMRDLKYYIWLLTYSQYPHHKIQRYERGEHLREVDECTTLGSDESLYNTSTEEVPLESIVFRSESRNQIKQQIMRIERLRSPVESIQEESAEGETSRSFRNSEAQRLMNSDLNHSLKVNNLNQALGAGDFSYSFEEFDDLTSDEKIVAKKTGWIDYLIQNYPQDGVRSKGVLTLESDMKLVKKNPVLEGLLQERKNKEADSKPDPTESDQKLNFEWKDLQQLHRDTGNTTKEFSGIKLKLNPITHTGNTKEFSDIKLNFNQNAQVELTSSGAMQPAENDAPSRPVTFRPVKRVRVNFADKPNLIVTKAFQQFNSMPNKISTSSSDFKYFRSGRGKVPKRRPSRSVSKRRIQKNVMNSGSPNTTAEIDFASDEKLIESLQKMSRLRVNSLTSADFLNHGENLFMEDPEAKSTHNDDNERCKCALCTNASRSRSRRGSYRSRKSFDSRRSAEEIMEDKRKNRKRQNSRSSRRRRETRFEDPYQGKKNEFEKDQFAKHDDIFGEKKPPRRMKRNASGVLKVPRSQGNFGSNLQSKKSKIELTTKGFLETELSRICKISSISGSGTGISMILIFPIFFNFASKWFT